MFINVGYNNILEQESYFSVTLVISLLFGIKQVQTSFFHGEDSSPSWKLCLVLYKSKSFPYASCILAAILTAILQNWLVSTQPRSQVHSPTRLSWERSWFRTIYTCCVCHYSVLNANFKRVGSVTERKRILLHFERLKVLRFRKRKGNPTVTQWGEGTVHDSWIPTNMQRLISFLSVFIFLLFPMMRNQWAYILASRHPSFRNFKDSMGQIFKRRLASV